MRVVVVEVVLSGGTVAPYLGQQMEQNAAEVMQMVVEDVEVLKGHWAQQVKPELERDRVELWRTMIGVRQRLLKEGEGPSVQAGCGELADVEGTCGRCGQLQDGEDALPDGFGALCV